jgi:DNA-binding NarL/FixJ family response regulator
MKIFVVDDSMMLRERIIDMLSELSGIEISGQAQDAPSATQAICDLKPDVVTLDIQLIEGNGVDVLKKIKQEDHVPVVIMLTNSTALPYRKRCMAAGADFFLDKSTEFGKLRVIVQGLLERFQMTVSKAPLGFGR